MSIVFTVVKSAKKTNTIVLLVRKSHIVLWIKTDVFAIQNTLTMVNQNASNVTSIVGNVKIFDKNARPVTSRVNLKVKKIFAFVCLDFLKPILYQKGV